MGLRMSLGRVIEKDSLREDMCLPLAESSPAQDRYGVAGGVGKEGKKDKSDEDGEDTLKLLLLGSAELRMRESSDLR